MVYLTNCQRTLILVAPLGFEPRLFAFKVRCVTNSTKGQYWLRRVGFEPTIFSLWGWRDNHFSTPQYKKKARKELNTFFDKKEVMPIHHVISLSQLQYINCFTTLSLHFYKFFNFFIIFPNLGCSIWLDIIIKIFICNLIYCLCRCFSIKNF